jgi:DNA-binding beta-propeller fold protein YncE
MIVGRLLRQTALIGVAAGFLSMPAAARDADAPLPFTGRALVILSDADMLASAYGNRLLGEREGEDMLSVIPLGPHPRDLKASQAPVSNSVAGPPAGLAVTPDGRFAIVAESFAPRPNDNRTDQTFADLKNGRTITVIDISNPSSPQVVQRIEGLERPNSVSINADGTLVAISLDPRGAGASTPLALYRFANGRLSERPATPVVPGWTAGDALSHAEFHPRENMLALLNQTRDEMSFVRIETGAGTPSLAAYGNRVRVEKYPYMVRFTPDGRYAIANGLYWGTDVEGTWSEAPRGSVVSVRINAGQAPDGSPRHAFVSRAQTGVGPEGLVVSPDGTMVITTNVERSFLSYDDPRQTFFSSITFIRLDPESGVLMRVGDFAMDGILPESAAFDASSKSLAVLSFDHYNDRRTGGSVDFWRIAHDPLDPSRTELVRTEHSVTVQRGAHTMVLVR